MIGWLRHTGMALEITTSVKIIRRFWMRLRTIPPTPFLIWVVGPAETFAIFVYLLGHNAVGLDGSREFVAMARSYSGCEVLCQDFLTMILPESRFDGVFANASLFHVPSRELPRVLLELSEAPGRPVLLKPKRKQRGRLWRWPL